MGGWDGWDGELYGLMGTTSEKEETLRKVEKRAHLEVAILVFVMWVVVPLLITAFFAWGK